MDWEKGVLVVRIVTHDRKCGVFYSLVLRNLDLERRLAIRGLMLKDVIVVAFIIECIFSIAYYALYGLISPHGCNIPITTVAVECQVRIGHRNDYI